MLLLLRRFIAATTLFGYVLNFLGLPQFCFAMDSEELPTKRSHSLMVSGPLSPQGIHFVPASSIFACLAKEEPPILLGTVPCHSNVLSSSTSLQKETKVPGQTPDAVTQRQSKPSQQTESPPKPVVLPLLPSQRIHFVSAESFLPQRPTKEELYTLLKAVPPHFARTSLTQLPQVPWSLPDTFLSMIWTDFTGSQERLTLPKGYNYATLQGQKYVSDALFFSTKEGAQWTCVLDKKSLFFDYKPSQQGETTLSFTLSQDTLRITKMKTREAQIEFGGNTFFDWQEAVNGPSHALKVASLNIINKSFLTSQTVNIYANQYKNQGHSEAKEAFFLVGHLINTGQVLRAQQLKIQSNIIDNEGGHLLGQDVNEVEISQKLNNKGGEISSEGKMSLSFDYNLYTVKDAGTIRGMEIFILKDLKKLLNGFYTILNFKTGTLQGTQKVTLQMPFFEGEQLEIITPLCVMQVKDFFLSPQTQCGRFVLSLNASQNFTLKNPFATKGSFEIWQEGLKTQEDVDKAMEERFQERKQAPVLGSKIHLKNNLQAGFLRIFMPSAKVILGEERGPLLDILMEEGDVDIAVTSFDLQKATFATQTVSIYAPDGIRLGRLETDPEKKVFVPFCWHGQQAHSPNLGNYISSVFYDFRGQRLTDTYDGHVLSRLPVVRGNGSSFSIQNTATLRGPLTQEAMFVAKDLSLSSKTALFEGSVTRIHNNFIFNEDCTLTVQPATGVFNFTYRNTRGTYFKYGTQSFVNSEGATLRVEGRLLSRHPVTLINKASILYAGNKSPLVVVQDQILKSDLFQKTFEGRAELDRLTTQPCANQYRSVSGCSHRVEGSLIAAQIFLEKTNNFAGAVNTFMPTTTFREGVIFGTHEAIPLNLSSPLAIVLIGQEGRVIGLENPHVVTSQSPFADLMEKPLDFGTTRLNIFLKDFSSKPSHFKFQERFWFDDENAQRFYESIREDIILFSPEGIFQKLDNPFLTLSPKILLARIQEAVQKKLGRGYIDHGKPIDEAYACELHRNATEHLRSLPGCILKATGLTLLRQDAVNIPLSQKPLIYYKKVVDETGGTSLSPEMSFPAHLLNPMGTVRNTKIHVGTLLAISEGMTLEEAQKCFEGKAAQQAILSTILQERPTLLALLEAPEGPNALALKGGPDALALKGENQLALKVSHGPLALHGDFETDTLMVLSAGKLTCHGDTRINTIHALLASLFDDVEAKAWVERISHSNGYEDVLKGCFEIVAEGALCISAGRDLTLVAAHTRSKLGTYFQAARDSFDLPAVLQSHFSSTSGSKKKKRTETRDVSLPVG